MWSAPHLQVPAQGGDGDGRSNAATGLTTLGTGATLGTSSATQGDTSQSGGSQGDDTSGGHGGSDIKVAWHFTQSILENRPAPIDVYRAIEYTLPGILAARSADLEGHPIAIPDLRTEPFTGTHFWDTLGLPETDPPGTPYCPPG